MSVVNIPSPTACACPSVEVRIQGELDISTVPRLRERLTDALTLRPTHLYLDLSDCSFFDACGITLLLEIHRQAWRQRASFVLRGCNARHRRILALMGLNDVFDLDDGHAPPCL